MSKTGDILGPLTTLRDEGRVQLHLLSMDARTHWQDLETKLSALETKLDQGGGKLSDALVATERDLTAKVKEFLKTHVKSDAPMI